VNNMYHRRLRRLRHNLSKTQAKRVEEDYKKLNLQKSDQIISKQANARLVETAVPVSMKLCVFSLSQDRFGLRSHLQKTSQRIHSVI
jgi:hypothetical protein